MGRSSSILRITVPRVAATLLAPWLIACALTWLALRGHPDSSGDPVDTAMLWLQLPITVLAIAAVLATLEAWPGFGRDRTGGDLVDRLQLGPLDGCGIASLAGCAVVAGLMLVTGLGFGLLVDRDAGRPVDHGYSLHSADGPQLSPGGSLRFELREAAMVDRIEARPRMPLSPAGSFETCRLAILDQDGKPLGEELLVESHGERVSLRFAERRLEAVELRHLDGRLPLWLPDGSVHADRAGAVPAWLNTGLGALSAVVSAALTLALLMLGRRQLSLGVAVTAGLALPLLWNLSGLSPQSAAIAACARDQWCLNAAVLDRSFWSLSIATLAMLLAVVIRRPRDTR